MGIVSCVFVIIGVIIGAGFASGKEIYTFFFVYGKYGILGIVVSVYIIGYLIYKTLKIIKEYDINSYDEFLDIILGSIKTKNIDLKIIVNFIVNVFLLITFFVMCAGFSAYFNQEFGINQFTTSLLLAVLCYFILNKNINGIFILNSILMPVIIIILLALGIKAFDLSFDLKEISSNGKWILNALLYASYNSITLVSILIPMKKYIKTKKDILKIVCLSSLIIIILAFVIFILLLSINENIKEIELPSVYAANSFGVIYKYLYGGIILRSNINNYNIISIRIFK